MAPFLYCMGIGLILESLAMYCETSGMFDKARNYCKRGYRKVVRKFLEGESQVWYNIWQIFKFLMDNGGRIMAVSYNRLWKLLVDRKMSKTLEVDYGDIMEYVKD